MLSLSLISGLAYSGMTWSILLVGNELFVDASISILLFQQSSLSWTATKQKRSANHSMESNCWALKCLCLFTQMTTCFALHICHSILKIKNSVTWSASLVLLRDAFCWRVIRVFAFLHQMFYFSFAQFLEYKAKELFSTFQPSGKLSPNFFAGKSKGYGFVEWQHNKEKSSQARQMIDNKRVGSCTLHCEFLEPAILSFEDLHSKCIRVDHLPSGYNNEAELKGILSRIQTPTFFRVRTIHDRFLTSEPKPKTPHPKFCGLFLNHVVSFSWEHGVKVRDLQLWNSRLLRKRNKRSKK